MKNINKKIDELSGLYAMMQELESMKERLVKQVIPVEIYKAMSDIEAEYAPVIEFAKNNIEKMEKEIKEDVVALGETAKSSGITVSYSVGKTTWNNDLLIGYIEKHPKSPVAKAKNTPKPFASIYKKG